MSEMKKRYAGIIKDNVRTLGEKEFSEVFLMLAFGNKVEAGLDEFCKTNKMEYSMRKTGHGGSARVKLYAIKKKGKHR